MTIYRHEASGALPDGETYTFGIHTSRAASTVEAAEAAWASAIADLWLGSAPPADAIGHLYPAAVTLVETVTTELDPVTGKNVAQVQSAHSLAGTGAGGALPQEVAVCVSLRTALPTRAGRGRFFLPSPILTTCVASRLDPDAQDSILNAAALMLGDMITSLFVPVIYHRTTKTSTVVTRVDVGDVFDSMRTRRDKLREVRVTQGL